MELIPGFPNDLAMHLLIGLARPDRFKLRQVSKTWNRILASDEFHRLRRKHNALDKVLLLVVSGHNVRIVSRGRLLAFDLNSSSFGSVRVPGFVENHLELLGLRCVAIGERFLLLGGASMDGIGGFSSHGTTSIYDCGRDAWTQGVSMNVSRSHFASGSIEGVAYVAGGLDFEKSAEAFDVGSNEWRTIASMPFGFEDIESSVVWKNKLLVKGLVNYGQRKMLVYNPEVDRWTATGEQIPEGELVSVHKDLYVLDKQGYISKYNDGAGEGWRRIVKVSLVFQPRLVPRKQTPRTLLALGCDAFLLGGLDDDDETSIGSFKKSMHLLSALPRAFWQWQGTILEM